MGVRSSSLLRPRPASRGLAILLAAAWAGAGTALVHAAVLAPDPSPAPRSPAPDPYPPRLAAAPRVPSSPAAAPTVVRKAVVQGPAHRSTPARRRSRPAGGHRPAATPAPRLPTYPAPGLGARFSALAAAEPGSRVPRELALAVALLVLLSAALVAGAAREVAR